MWLNWLEKALLFLQVFVTHLLPTQSLRQQRHLQLHPLDLPHDRQTVQLQEIPQAQQTDDDEGHHQTGSPIHLGAHIGSAEHLPRAIQGQPHKHHHQQHHEHHREAKRSLEAQANQLEEPRVVICSHKFILAVAHSIENFLVQVTHRYLPLVSSIVAVHGKDATSPCPPPPQAPRKFPERSAPRDSANAPLDSHPCPTSPADCRGPRSPLTSHTLRRRFRTPRALLYRSAADA